MYVCLPNLYVCSPSLYVCVYASVRMSGKNHAPEDEVRFRTKNVQYLSFNSTFGDSWEGGIADDPDIQNPSACEAFSKLVCHCGFFQTPSACEAKPLCLWGFFKTPLPVRLFQNPTQACMYGCQARMYVCRACLYVWGKSCSRGRGQIPYENVQYFTF